MAKKLPPVSTSPKKAGRPKLDNPKERKPVALTIRAGDDWIQWLDGLCEKIGKDSGIPKPDRTALIDYALSRLASERGYKESPPRY